VVVALIVGFFVAVVCAYGCTEYLLVQLDVRRRMVDRGLRTLIVIAAANLMSFALIWVSSLAFVAASGTGVYLYATIACAGAQLLWLGQHLWAYYRDHPRLHYEQ
jgi:cytosine/uracil/thiamine/allantoin permease